MKPKTSIVPLIGVVLLVQFFWIRSDNYFDKALPFLSGLTAADTAAGNIFLIMYSYLPVPFLLLKFSGEMRELTEGYGLLVAIRGGSKGNLLIRLMCRTFCEIATLVMIMGALYTIGKAEYWEMFSGSKQVQAVTLYAFTMITLVQLQWFLELYIESYYANGMVILWGIAALFVSGSIGKEYEFFNLFLFPNLAFAQKNGVLLENGVSVTSAYCTLILIYLVLTCFMLYRFKRKDMI